MKKSVFITLLLILGLGIFLRIYNIYSYNILFDYDQIEDLFHTRKILMGDPPIIGRAVYGNPNLHHGVLYFYFNLLPFILFNWNPLLIASWNSIFNAGVSLLLFFFARSLFKSNAAGLIAALVAAVSYNFIQFSAWISSMSLALITVPLYFFGLWSFFKKKYWGLILAAIGLGLSLQLDISFLYLVPVFFILWVIFRPKFPRAKTLIFSALAFLISTSTLILTELKLKFAGVNTLLHFSQVFEDAKIGFADRTRFFFGDFWDTFSSNLLPTESALGLGLGVAIISLAFFSLREKSISKEEKFAILFLLVYLFSPAVKLLLGYQRQPWFLVGIPPAIALLSGYVLSRFRNFIFVLVLLGIFAWSNISMVFSNRNNGPIYFKPEPSSLLSSQLAVVDYTYKESSGQPFAINAVAYPLYYNGLWEYHYKWYGLGRYGYLPGWLGGDQPILYALLNRPAEDTKHSYMIIDETFRIPDIHKLKGREWAQQQGETIEEKNINGFTILKLINE